MNMYRPLQDRTDGKMSPDGMVTVPEHIRRATGLVPGRPVVIGLNDRGEVVILTRTQAKRMGETREERRVRIDAALAEAASGKYSTGQSTAEVMAELRGDRS